MKVLITSCCLISLLVFYGCNEEINDANDSTSSGDDSATSLSCDGSYEPKGSRTLGLDLLDLSESGTFNENVAKAKTLGVGAIALHVNWDQIETSPSTYTDPNGSIAALDAVATANSFKFSLTIRPIDLTGKTLPSDLEDDPTNTDRFNTTNVVNRATAMLDKVLSTYVTPSNIMSIQIGNEIDGYNTGSEHADFWSDYGHFLNAINVWMDANYPTVKVGFTITHSGATSGTLRDLGVWTSLAGVVDVVGVTYYPQDSGFQVHDPETVAADMQDLVDEFTATGKPIYLQEVGYQTSSTDNSSELKQAQFFCNFFSAWDTHRNDIPFASIVRLMDVSNAQAVTMAGDYGGAGNTAFVEYLRTLGLRSYGGTGTDKMAVSIIQSETSERGF